VSVLGYAGASDAAGTSFGSGVRPHTRPTASCTTTAGLRSRIQSATPIDRDDDEEQERRHRACTPKATAASRRAPAYDTSAYLKAVQSLYGLDALPCASASTTVSTMGDLFTIPGRCAPRSYTAPEGATLTATGGAAEALGIALRRM
jgi:hypothetical protein